MSAWYNEIDPFAAATLRELISDGVIAPGVVDERSIEDVTPAELSGFTQCHFFAGAGVWSYALRQAGWPDDRPVWTGSCPCQPFSAAGKGRGFDDERHLWPAFHWLIAQCRPVCVFGEQVVGKDGDVWLDLVQADVEALDYAFGCVPLASAGFGAPNMRHRSFWLAYANSAGLEGWERVLERADQFAVGANGMADRLGKPHGDGCEAGSLASAAARHGGSADAASAAGGVADAVRTGRPERRSIAGNGQASGCSIDGDGNPGPVNGFWRDADWLYCRDPGGPRWRPVMSTYVRLAARNPGQSVRGVREGGCVEAAKEQEGVITNAELQELRSGDFSSEIGTSASARKEGVLRPQVHGGRVRGKDQGSVCEGGLSAVEESGVGGLRNVRQNKAPSSPPSGREPPKQRTVELDDVVRLMSPSLALAELRSDHATTEALHVLRSAIVKAGMVRNSPVTIHETWASIGEEEKREIRHRFDAARWEVVAPFPLAKSIQGRAGLLKLYGNAINAVVAEEFIAAAREILPHAA